MTPRERLLACLRGQPVDRVPLDLKGPCAYANRTELEAGEADPARREIFGRVLEKHHYTVGIGGAGNRFLCTPPQYIRQTQKVLANGRTATYGVIDTPKGELTFESQFDPVARTGWMVKYPCATEEDIRKIQSVPSDPPPDLPPPMPELTDDFAARGILRAGVNDPMVCVAAMMKFETFLEYTATHRDWMLELIDIVVQRELAILERVLELTDLDYVWMGGSEWVTPPMGSPALYDATVQEQERALIDYIHTHSKAIVHVHCHGNVRHALKRTIERGADFTEPVEPPPDGDITMAEAKALAAGRITLGGNVEARVLNRESVDTVEAATRAAFAGGKERFILSTSEGPSPQVGPVEFANYMKLIDVWEELSPIAGAASCE